MSIAENLAAIHERIARAARQAGRTPEDVALMAVTKTVPAARIAEAYEAGHRLFGENRVQEFADKAGALARLADAEFHMIGHLQSNKASKAAEIFHAVDSVDSAKLAERLNVAAAKLGKTVDVLLEINIGGEEAKSGVAPESEELERILAGGEQWSSLRIRGLMTVPPFMEDPEGARPYFRRLRELRDQLARRDLAGVKLETLSMGMSHDFEVAIEEGSTCVRIGTAIFGEREKE
ncbi:MAG TPA: YggS family pyridoxal phosphate-dependent enzyme [Terriglobales bacterium]|jgi:pyridoxal phosphate enzyme (YggS family)|nr:YggS family pyridoxal phosphate-dependent enzyme [Terriglobales bacterium]